MRNLFFLFFLSILLTSCLGGSGHGEGYVGKQPEDEQQLNDAPRGSNFFGGTEIKQVYHNILDQKARADYGVYPVFHELSSDWNCENKTQLKFDFSYFNDGFHYYENCDDFKPTPYSELIFPLSQGTEPLLIYNEKIYSYSKASNDELAWYCIYRSEDKIDLRIDSQNGIYSIKAIYQVNGSQEVFQDIRSLSKLDEQTVEFNTYSFNFELGSQEQIQFLEFKNLFSADYSIDYEFTCYRGLNQ
ncbi:MAG: hypothetical protein H6620_10375 [Halobacteriovoraceae bacterium]|nr:hypothetical protein [Halobacteriovoraceae bacterium]